MYSVVLLTAMTATAETPSFGDMWAKHCFWECCWPAHYGWVPCGGGLPYYPTPYYSCHGGGYFHHTGYGCSCYGCGACWGWGYGYGGGCVSLGGCWSPCYNCYGGGGIYQGVGYAGFSAYGNFGNYGMVPYIGAPAFAPPVITIRPAESANIEAKPTPSRPQVELNRSGTASILVKVPAESKVFVNDYQMKSISTERRFTSPELELGRDYYYTIRVVVEKDGKSLEDSRRVIIRAGETSSLAFDNLDRPRDDGRAIVEAKPKP